MATSQKQKQTSSLQLPALTCETVLHALALTAALVTRVVGLSRFALTGRELEGAVAALTWVRGNAQTGLAYSPLQWLLQAPLMAFTRASEVTVRLPVALASVALILVIYGTRHALGRARALVLAALVTLSPTLLHYGRQADGAFVSAAAALATTLVVHHARHTGQASAWRWVAVAFAVGLCSGAGFWTWLLAALLAGTAAMWFFKWTPQLYVSGQPLDRQPLLWFGVAFVGLSTALLTHPAGLGATLELTGDWFAGWRSTEPWFWPLHGLVLYEPLLLLLGALGGVHAWRERETLGLSALLWLGIALLVALLGQRSLYWLPGVVAPLALLAADGALWLLQVWRQGRGLEAHVATICLVVLLAFGVMNVLMYAQSNQREFAWLAAGAVLVLLVLWAGFWAWEGRAAALASGALLLAAVLGAMTVRMALAVGYQTARDPREPLVYDSVVLSPRQMAKLLRDSSLVEAGDGRTLDIVWAPELDLEARWYLREMHDAHPQDAANWHDAEALFVSPGQDTLAPAGYVGQHLAWRAEWDGEGLPASDWLRWLLLREPVGWQSTDAIALWYRFER